MGVTAQSRELATRLGAVGRLGKATLAQRQGLVGAQHQAARTASGDGARLLACKHRGEFARVLLRAALLDRPLVDVSGLDRDGNSGIAQDRMPARALRREHQRFAGEPKRRRSARKLMTAAAVSSIERRVTSMLDQLCRAHSLRENGTSSATALRSMYW